MKQTKKGFTLVELLVVIAILAILATVSVVGYTTFIEKANRSVDEQAVAQINTALMAANIPEGSITNIAQVQALLDECNLEIEDYKPLSKEKFFFYDSSLNRVIYTDNNYNVLYPQELADDINKESWFSLSGSIFEATLSSDWVNESADSNHVIVTVGSAEQLFAISNNIKKYSGKTIEINITTDLNMMGAALSFSSTNADVITLKSTKTGGVPAVISNIAITEAAIEDSKENASNWPRDYGGGLFYEVGAGDIITIENITISNAQIGGYMGNVGAFVGRVTTGGKLTLTNCRVENSIIIGQKKVGALIGFAQFASSPSPVIAVSGCSVDNVTVQTYEGEAGTVMGAIQATTTACETMGFNSVTVTNSKVVYIGTSKITLAEAAQLGYNYEGAEFYGLQDNGTEYRPFASDAKYLIIKVEQKFVK
ncbi:MAG: prepilin-type N-terminal cleavage/methylation domain-containing protein [Clostridia bacterium]|nr:prepilin-type N-terminal cleavage/methylation domain-containing protein [Clostridia bacterium]